MKELHYNLLHIRTAAQNCENLSNDIAISKNDLCNELEGYSKGAVCDTMINFTASTSACVDRCRALVAATAGFLRETASELEATDNKIGKNI